MNLRSIAKMVEEANKVKNPAEEFLYMLNETIVRESMEKNIKRKPSQAYHPSSLGGCLRNNYYQRTGAEVELRREDPESVGMSETGTARHESIQEYIQKMTKHGFSCEWIPVEQYLTLHPQPGTVVVERQGNETKVKNDILNLSFKCDGIIRLNQVYYVVEIKNEISFKYMGQTEVFENHLVQACSYAAAFDIPRVIMLYENRDNCQKKPFYVEVTPQQIDEHVVGRINKIESYVEAGRTPPKTTKKSECRYCAYAQLCEKEGDTEPLG